MKTIHREEGAGPEYSRESWFAGGSWESFERGVVPGTVRHINGLLMRAWHVHWRGPFRAHRVHWISIEPEALRKVGINERPCA
jgi:hypothetical protein